MRVSEQIERYIRGKLLKRAIVTFIIAYITSTAVGFFTVRHIFLQQTEKELKTFTGRVAQGLTYQNGTWDTSRYAADPQTPHPSGSSGFSTPLYIISADGFVIERNSPISGVLDTSDFNHLNAFTKPQTIKLLTKDQWRLYSKPISQNGKTLGIVVVGLYHPEKYIPEVADQKLNMTIEYLLSKSTVSNGEINVSEIDLRNIDYDVSFEIVTNYNKVLLNNGRMPTFIDKSYVHNELKNGTSTRTVTDPTQRKDYMVVSQPLYDHSRTVTGVVVAARPLDFIPNVIINALWIVIGFGILVAAAIGFLLHRMIAKTARELPEFYATLSKNKPLPERISFDRESGELLIDGTTISLPPSSNQYLLCKTIFSNSQKHWTARELLNAFGGGGADSRKVYDAMVLINKKVESVLPVRLIEVHEKTYFLNPDLASKVAS